MLNKKPFFSVIIPTFNRAHLISEAIKSVLYQTFTDWELIIVDDGSTDNTKDIVDEFEDERIKYIYQVNSERSVARNNGIRNAKGEWICFLDSDDEYLDNHLEVFYQAIHEFRENLFFVSGVYTNNKGILDLLPMYTGNNHPAKFILETTTITPIAVCVNRKCFNQHSFIEKYKKSYWEDTHLWLRLSIEYSMIQINSITAVLNEHDNRSIKQYLSMQRVNEHIKMINDLDFEHPQLMERVFHKKDWKKYIDRKYRMFLYTTRQNKQLSVSLQIWLKAMLHKPSFYLCSELPKILLNQFNIGIHASE